MANIFNSVSAKTPKRHKFKLNHQAKLTGEMGELLPIFCQDVLPGDRFRIATQQLVRFAPMIAPIMSDIDCYVHFFFVPNRLIWKDWETFITGSKNGKKVSEEDLPAQPKLRIPYSWLNKKFSEVQSGIEADEKRIGGNCSLMDYLQFPTVDKDFAPSRDAELYYDVDELPFRAYQRIFFDWYRDENLSSFDDFDVIDTEDYNNGINEIQAPDAATQRGAILLKLQRRAWKKDYFTSALPFAQKGDDVLIPGSGAGLSGFVPLQRLKEGDSASTSGIYDFRIDTKTNTGWTPAMYDSIEIGNVNTSTPRSVGFLINQKDGSNSGKISFNVENFGINFGDTNISEGTIRELRRAMAAQRFLEREAVAGSRYIEQILAFFGVKSSDARLQRSEFLGGSKQPVVVSQVLQTSQSTTEASSSDPSPLGQPAGNAVSAGGKYIFDRTFEEHGWVIGLLSVVPRAEYMNGYPRKYMKNDRFDYYWPQFAHIGEQEIKRGELKFDFFSNNPRNDETFGYTPRYAEYRFINSHVHGDFKDTLEYWTLVRDFGKAQPLLNEEFITCKPSTRIFAYEEDKLDFNHLWIQVGFNIDALRPLPKYGESI